MMSVSAFTLLVYLALGLCVLTPCLLLALAVIDFVKEKLW